MDDRGPGVSGRTCRIAQESAEAYLAGDLDNYARVLPHADDFTLMPPFGGPTRHGFVLDDETREATRSTFRGGHVEVEVNASYVTDDLAVLVVVERQRGLVGDLAGRLVPPRHARVPT